MLPTQISEHYKELSEQQQGKLKKILSDNFGVQTEDIGDSYLQLIRLIAISKGHKLNFDQFLTLLEHYSGSFPPSSQKQAQALKLLNEVDSLRMEPCLSFLDFENNANLKISWAEIKQRKEEETLTEAAKRLQKKLQEAFIYFDSNGSLIILNKNHEIGEAYYHPNPDLKIVSYDEVDLVFLYKNMEYLHEFNSSEKIRDEICPEFNFSKKSIPEVFAIFKKHIECKPFPQKLAKAIEEGYGLVDDLIIVYINGHETSVEKAEISRELFSSLMECSLQVKLGTLFGLITNMVDQQRIVWRWIQSELMNYKSENANRIIEYVITHKKFRGSQDPLYFLTCLDGESLKNYLTHLTRITIGQDATLEDYFRKQLDLKTEVEKHQNLIEQYKLWLGDDYYLNQLGQVVAGEQERLLAHINRLDPKRCAQLIKNYYLTVSNEQIRATHLLFMRVLSEEGGDANDQLIKWLIKLPENDVQSILSRLGEAGISINYNYLYLASTELRSLSAIKNNSVHHVEKIKQQPLLNEEEIPDLEDEKSQEFLKSVHELSEDGLRDTLQGLLTKYRDKYLHLDKKTGKLKADFFTPKERLAVYEELDKVQKKEDPYNVKQVKEAIMELYNDHDIKKKAGLNRRWYHYFIPRIFINKRPFSGLFDTLEKKFKNPILEKCSNKSYLKTLMQNEAFKQECSAEQLQEIQKVADPETFIQLINKHWSPRDFDAKKMVYKGNIVTHDAFAKAQLKKHEVSGNELTSLYEARKELGLNSILPSDYTFPGKNPDDYSQPKELQYQLEDMDIRAGESILDKLCLQKNEGSIFEYLLFPFSENAVVDPQKRDHGHFHYYQAFKAKLQSVVTSQEPKKDDKPIIIHGTVNVDGVHYVPFFVHRYLDGKVTVFTVDPSAECYSGPKNVTVLEKAFRDIFPGSSFQDPRIAQQLNDRDCGFNSLQVQKDAITFNHLNDSLFYMENGELKIDTNHLSVNANPERAIIEKNENGRNVKKYIYRRTLKERNKQVREEWAQKFQSIDTIEQLYPNFDICKEYRLDDLRNNSPERFTRIPDNYDYSHNVATQNKNDELKDMLSYVSVLLSVDDGEINQKMDSFRKEFLQNLRLPQGEQLNYLINHINKQHQNAIQQGSKMELEEEWLASDDGVKSIHYVLKQSFVGVISQALENKFKDYLAKVKPNECYEIEDALVAQSADPQYYNLYEKMDRQEQSSFVASLKRRYNAPFVKKHYDDFIATLKKELSENWFSLNLEAKYENMTKFVEQKLNQKEPFKSQFIYLRKHQHELSQGSKHLTEVIDAHLQQIENSHFEGLFEHIKQQLENLDTPALLSIVVNCGRDNYLELNSLFSELGPETHRYNEQTQHIFDKFYEVHHENLMELMTQEFNGRIQEYLLESFKKESQEKQSDFILNPQELQTFIYGKVMKFSNHNNIPTALNFIRKLSDDFKQDLTEEFKKILQESLEKDDSSDYLQGIYTPKDIINYIDVENMKSYLKNHIQRKSQSTLPLNDAVNQRNDLYVSLIAEKARILTNNISHLDYKLEQQQAALDKAYAKITTPDGKQHLLEELRQITEERKQIVETYGKNKINELLDNKKKTALLCERFIIALKKEQEQPAATVKIKSDINQSILELQPIRFDLQIAHIENNKTMKPELRKLTPILVLNSLKYLEACGKIDNEIYRSLKSFHDIVKDKQGLNYSESQKLIAIINKAHPDKSKFYKSNEPQDVALRALFQTQEISCVFFAKDGFGMVKNQPNNQMLFNRFVTSIYKEELNSQDLTIAELEISVRNYQEQDDKAIEDLSPNELIIRGCYKINQTNPAAFQELLQDLHKAKRNLPQHSCYLDLFDKQIVNNFIRNKCIDMWKQIKAEEDNANKAAKVEIKPIEKLTYQELYHLVSAWKNSLHSAFTTLTSPGRWFKPQQMPTYMYELHLLINHYDKQLTEGTTKYFPDDEVHEKDQRLLKLLSRYRALRNSASFKNKNSHSTTIMRVIDEKCQVPKARKIDEKPNEEVNVNVDDRPKQKYLIERLVDIKDVYPKSDVSKMCGYLISLLERPPTFSAGVYRGDNGLLFHMENYNGKFEMLEGIKRLSSNFVYIYDYAAIQGKTDTFKNKVNINGCMEASLRTLLEWKAALEHKEGTHEKVILLDDYLQDFVPIITSYFELSNKQADLKNVSESLYELAKDIYLRSTGDNRIQKYSIKQFQDALVAKNYFEKPEPSRFFSTRNNVADQPIDEQQMIQVA